MTSAGDMQVLDHVLQLDADRRRELFLQLAEEDRKALAAMMDERIANPMYRFRGDHLRFVKEGLGEGTWSGQDRILEAVDKYPRVVVVATHSIGKSHISSRVVLGTGCVWPAGLARITTTATNYRQVSNILWPYIRRTHVQYGLVGEVLRSPRWQIGNELIADGFSAAQSDETTTQGMHANGEFLLVVDEAGGISDTLGRAFNALLTNDDAHALVIGNAPTDREGSWFEKIAQEGSGWHVIKISAFDTPNFTNEDTDYCTVCPPTIERHRVKKHLTSPGWVKQVEDEFGTDSAFYIARVKAEFPKNITSKTLPLTWLEAAQVKRDAADNEEPPMPLEEWLASLDTTKPVSLGADIASDGGDELSVAWKVGLDGWIGVTTSGPAIAKPRDAAMFILDEIQRAEEWHRKHGIPEPVRVKYDAIGIGWGVGGILEEYRDQGRHSAELVPVNVAERASEPEKYQNQRAELWWSMREWITPPTNEDGTQGTPLARLFVGMRELAQLNGPTYAVRNGRIIIESKDSMRARRMRSPDRAESLLLAFFEPPVWVAVVPDAGEVPDLLQANQWDYTSGDGGEGFHDPLA
jgi:hypothetical protein